MRRIIRIALFLLLFTLFVSAASAQWQTLTFRVPYGDSLTIIAADEATVTLTCETGIVATTNAGRSSYTFRCRPFDAIPEMEGREAKHFGSFR